MTAIAVSSRQNHAELWTSFASLLRSYCAAHGLNSTMQAVVEVSAEQITVRVGQCWLSLVEHMGVVLATRDDGTTRGYQLHDDGTLSSGGRPEQREELDMAAERFAREMF